ncbi:biotin/lipoate A/B protein ligase family protein [Planctomyces sp. SH-PL62]|uniref:lipoate--protein ligase family protein n=1 Tax=Planctomyces sp. SH-PL62 TaxID=1636152 RepID=UPI00078E8F50|nr:lipoate--protein ligase family protein [Planctomyces sp. SH-PL62]AMV37433.1 Octanoyltransferase LipM [Planctomyces sp. SH-PL62]
MICRILPYHVAEGPTNMAIDEALLDLVARDPSSAWLRTYGWATPTLSLGYFQRWAETEAEPRWRDAAKVRRSTGGGAIWHENELTFAIVIPSDHPLARPNTALYRAVHRATADLLASRAVEARRHGELDPAEAGAEAVAVPDHPFLCFAGRDGEDLVHRGVKLLGSAQRRRAGAVLQHSSLLLRAADAVPELPGAADLADVSDDARDWADALAAPLARALGMDPAAALWPDGLLDHAGRIEREVYRNPDWNHKR